MTHISPWWIISSAHLVHIHQHSALVKGLEKTSNTFKNRYRIFVRSKTWSRFTTFIENDRQGLLSHFRSLDYFSALLRLA